MMIPTNATRIYLPDEVKLGWWYTECCERDLEQITNPETLQYVQDNLRGSDHDGVDIDAWPTFADALFCIFSGNIFSVSST